MHGDGHASATDMLAHLQARRLKPRRQGRELLPQPIRLTHGKHRRIRLRLGATGFHIGQFLRGNWPFGDLASGAVDFNCDV